MRLILHIGTEKTRTTAVRNWLRRNRKRLAGHRVWVPWVVRTSLMGEFAVACRARNR